MAGNFMNRTVKNQHKCSTETSPTVIKYQIILIVTFT